MSIRKTAGPKLVSLLVGYVLCCVCAQRSHDGKKKSLDGDKNLSWSSSNSGLLRHRRLWVNSRTTVLGYGNYISLSWCFRNYSAGFIINVIFKQIRFEDVFLRKTTSLQRQLDEKFNYKRELDSKSYGREGGVASFGSLCLSLFSFMVDFCSWLNAFGDSFFCF